MLAALAVVLGSIEGIFEFVARDAWWLRLRIGIYSTGGTSSVPCCTGAGGLFNRYYCRHGMRHSWSRGTKARRCFGA